MRVVSLVNLERAEASSLSRVPVFILYTQFRILFGNFPSALVRFVSCR